MKALMKSRLAPMLALILGATSLYGCSIFPPRLYRTSVAQGHGLSLEAAETWMRSAFLKKEGSLPSEEQVVEQLGYPLLEPASEKLWQYVYSFRPNDGRPVMQRILTIHFEGGRAVAATLQVAVPLRLTVEQALREFGEPLSRQKISKSRESWEYEWIESCKPGRCERLRARFDFQSDRLKRWQRSVQQHTGAREAQQSSSPRKT